MKHKITIKPGEEWLTVFCQNSACGRTILIAQILPAMLDENDVVTFDFAPQKVKCPSCQSELVYQKEALQRRKAQRYQ